MSSRIRGPFALVLFVFSLVSISGFATPLLHFELDRSSPEADSEGDSPATIDLWFTQAPQENSTTIRLLNSAGDLVSTSEVRQDSGDDMHQIVDVEGTLTAGSYTVSWRSMAADGHVVRGDFAFRVNGNHP